MAFKSKSLLVTTGKQERLQTIQVEIQASVRHVLVNQHLLIPLGAKSEKSN